MPSVVAILPEGFEEIETVTPIDLLRRAGVDVTIAALGSELLVKGRCELVLQAETMLDQVLGRSHDCLFLPGGPGFKLMRADARVRQLVLEYHKRDAWLAAICAAPAVLHDAGLLRGRRYTAHTSMNDELPDILSGLRVVVDGRIITSRGAGTSVDFGLALVEHLVSPAKAREISAAICF